MTFELLSLKPTEHLGQQREVTAWTIYGADDMLDRSL
jgi:hypothetical protein